MNARGVEMGRVRIDARHWCVILAGMLLLSFGLFFLQLQNYNALLDIARRQDRLINQQMGEILRLSQGAEDFTTPAY